MLVNERIELLERLNRLRARGILTEEEYRIEQQRLLEDREAEPPQDHHFENGRDRGYDPLEGSGDGAWFNLNWRDRVGIIAVAVFLVACWVGSREDAQRKARRDREVAQIKASEDAEDAQRAAQSGLTLQRYQFLKHEGRHVAAIACRQAVREQARWTSENSGGLFGSIDFSWEIIDANNIRIRSRNVRMTNGFGGARDVSYSCTYNFTTNTPLVESIS